MTQESQFNRDYNRNALKSCLVFSGVILTAIIGVATGVYFLFNHGIKQPVMPSPTSPQQPELLPGQELMTPTEYATPTNSITIEPVDCFGIATVFPNHKDVTIIINGQSVKISQNDALCGIAVTPTP